MKQILGMCADLINTFTYSPTPLLPSDLLSFYYQDECVFDTLSSFKCIQKYN